MVAGGPMAWLPEPSAETAPSRRSSSSEDIRADQAEAYGLRGTPCPTPILDAFVEALATRIAGFDKDRHHQAPCQHQACRRDAELGAGWDAHRFAQGPAAQEGDQSAYGARLPQAWGCRKSAWILFRSNRANAGFGQISTLDVADGRSKASLLARTLNQSWWMFGFPQRRRRGCVWAHPKSRIPGYRCAEEPSSSRRRRKVGRGSLLHPKVPFPSRWPVACRVMTSFTVDRPWYLPACRTVPFNDNITMASGFRVTEPG